MFIHIIHAILIPSRKNHETPETRLVDRGLFSSGRPACSSEARVYFGCARAHSPSGIESM